MFECAGVVYLLIPSPSQKRILHPGKIVALEAGSIAVELEGTIDLTTGFESLIFTEVRGKFMQQGCQLESVVQDQDKLLHRFNRIGEILSAEQRQTFRVSVSTQEIFARIGRQSRCHVVDVSAEGFAAIASPGIELGSIVATSIVHDGEAINADARVQTCKVLPSGKIRFGFLVPAVNKPARKQLQKLSTVMQRYQLRRMSGAA